MHKEFWITILILLVSLLLIGGPFLFKKDFEDVFPIIRKQNRPKNLENGSVFFPSRRNIVLTLSPWGVILIFLYFAASNGDVGQTVFLLILSAIILWIDSSIGYTISSTHLKVGKSEIALETLNKLCRSNNPISAQALSLKRIEITTKNGDLILISPVEEDYFVKLLSERSPNLIIDWNEFKN